MKVERFLAMIFIYTSFFHANVMYMSSGEKIPIAAESSSMMMVFFSFVVVFMSGLSPFCFVFFRLGGNVGGGARGLYRKNLVIPI